MLECPEKVNQASALLPVVNSANPAPAFGHQGQSGSAGSRSMPAWHTGLVIAVLYSDYMCSEPEFVNV
jgi:hypothetical protein